MAKSILIADDNPENIRVLSNILKLKGYVVRIALDGQQAVESVYAKSPDLIILDIQMPKMNGYEACQHIKAHKHLESIPIIFISALTETFNKVTAFNVGGADYISKPFQIEEVLVRVKTQLKIFEQQRQLEEVNFKLFEQLKSTFEQAAVGIAHVDIKTMRFIKVNKLLTRFLGYSEEELLTKSIQDITHKDFIDSDKMSISDLMEGELASFSKEKQYIKKDGSLIWGEVTVSLVKYPKEDAPEYLLAIIKDISDRKIAEENSMKLTKAIEASLNSVVITNVEGIIEYINPAFTSTTGYSKKEAIGKTPNFLSSGYHDNEYYKKMWDTINSGCVWRGEILNRNKKGESYWESFSISPIINGKGKIVNFIAIKEDITKKKKMIGELKIAKEKAEANEQKLNEAQALAHIGHWALDLIKNELIWSDEIYKIFDCNPQEFEATYEAFLSFIHPEDRDLVNNAYTEHLKNKKAYNIVHRIQLSDGEIKYVNEQCRSNFDENGNAIYSMGTVADITPRILIETELKNAKEKAEESDRLKSAFLASMSHEIRTPLNAIVGFSGIIAKRSNNQDFLKFFDVIKNQNELLLKLIDDLINFAKFESGSLEIVFTSFDLNKLINDLFIILKEKCPSEVTLVPKLPSNSFYMVCDEQRLKQIFLNLILNAIKFTKKGTIKFGYELEGNSIIKCFVTDTGIGIPKEKQKVIFERFIKLDTFSQGTGLGLPIVKNITQLLGGNLWLESEPGRGSSFYFTIPQQKGDPLDESNNLRKNKRTQIENCKLLVVEDDTANYLYIKEVLNEQNINTIIHANNGKEAVDLCRSNNDIDIILMDLKMPVLDGYEATKQIKKIKPNLPIIAVSAHALPAEKKKALEAGCNGFATKPISEVTLQEILTEYLIMK